MGWQRGRITGTYEGRPFLYVDPPEAASVLLDPDGTIDSYWWEEGNMACDCNRGVFVGRRLDCGETIRLTRVEVLGHPDVYLELHE
jgi:hypothetical protein